VVLGESFCYIVFCFTNVKDSKNFRNDMNELMPGQMDPTKQARTSMA